MARFSTPTRAFKRILSVRGDVGIYKLLLCVDFWSYYLHTISLEMLEASSRQIFTKWNTRASHNINPYVLI